MKKSLIAFVLLFFALSIQADEGMWLLKELNRQSVARMKELGFTFPIDKLYDENNPSLKDAVVIFGGGCSGVAVSDNGIIFTNHHCGFGAIQQLSSVEHDYLKDGFVAKSHKDELPAEGLTVSFLRSMEDVTSQVTGKIPMVYSEVQRANMIDSISKIMLKKYENDPFTRAQIVPFYTGNKYYMVVYDVFRDVRLVTTPPSSVGKFGGDTDNWMWPRHTGDYSVFRVYADSNNKPAKYSESNVPYRPKYVVPISLAGVTDGDYSMTIGYPGRTKRYKPSWGINQMMQSENAPRAEARGVKQDIWKEAMEKSDAVRIKYASKYAGSSNYWKNAIGMNEALTNLKVINDKEKIERDMTAWLDKNPNMKQKYGTTMPMLQEAYYTTNDLQKYSTYFMETLLSGIELTRTAFTLSRFNPNDSQAAKEEFVNRLNGFYKDYEPSLDQKVMPALMRLYADRVPAEFHPDIYNKVKTQFGGSYEKYADWVFSNSKFTNKNDLMNYLKSVKDVKELNNDPAMEFANSIRPVLMKLQERTAAANERIMKGDRDFMAALMEMNPDKAFSPDANFTQRLSYGSVKGYSPKDAVWYNYYTTTDGILQKEKAGDYEFDVQKYILDKIRNKDFGRYAAKDGKMHVAFLSDNDITGGNSGSPVFNGKAELIGLAFDGNWEALSGDIVFNKDLQRTISVDIRYVLYTIDKVMGGSHIINELKFAPATTVKAATLTPAKKKK